MIDNHEEELKELLLDALASIEIGMGVDSIAEKVINSGWLHAQRRDAWLEGFFSDPTGRYDGDVEEYGGNPYGGPIEPKEPLGLDPMPWKSKLQDTRFPKEPSHESTEFLPRRGYLQDREDYA